MINSDTGRTKFYSLGLFVLPLLLFAVAYREGLFFLAEKWMDMEHGAYNHGFLLLAVSLYLIYQRVDLLRDVSDQKRVWGFVGALFLSVGAFILGAVSVVSLQVLVIYGLVFCLILTLFGWAIFIKTLLPLGLLIFALPVWSWMGDFLQLVTHQMSYWLVKMSGIPVLEEGLYIMVPAGNFEVSEGCSGLSYFLAGSALAIIYAITNFHTKKNRIIVVCAIVAASIIANWLRVLVIIIAGQMTDMQHSLIEDHFNLGWVIFGCIFILLVIVFNKKLHEKWPSEKNETKIKTVRLNKKSMGLSAGLIGVGLVFLNYQFVFNNGDINKPLSELAASIKVPLAFTPSDAKYAWEPQVNGAQASFYLSDTTQLYVGLIGFQRQGFEVASYSSVVIDPKRWRVIDQQKIKTESLDLLQTTLQTKSGSQQYLLWSWYRVDGKNTASTLKAKIFELQGYLKGDNSGALLGMLIPKTSGKESEAEKTLLKLYQLIESTQANFL